MPKIKELNLKGDPNNTYVPGIGPRNPKIVIVGEAPFYEELAAEKPFVGASGRLLNSILQEAGINRNDCWVTNVCKYFVPASPKKKPIPFQKRAQYVGIDLNEQINDLRNEINQLNPNIIIGLGSIALWALTGNNNITDYRGSILEGFGRKVICTFHPAHILHSSGEATGTWNKNVMLFDLIRANKQSEFPDIQRPYRQLQVIRNSYEFHNFIKQYDHKSNPAIDIEAHHCVPICVGIAFTKEHGITVPLWNDKGISNIPSADLINIWGMLGEFLAKHKVVGQNFGYDRDKLKRLGFKVKGIHSDTMLKAFAISPELPKNLAFNTSIYTEEPFYKNEGMYEGSFEDLLIGCARDACCTKEVDDAQEADLIENGSVGYYRNFLLPLQGLYNQMEEEGFIVNEDKRKELLRKYIELDEQKGYEIYKLTGQYINVGSPLQVSKLLYDTLGIPAREGTGEEILTTIINNSKKPLIKDVCEAILEKRRVRRTIDSYAYALPDYDGKMRTSYFICLNTGRSSTSTQAPPIRPSEVIYKLSDGKKTKTHQERGMAFQTITKHGDIGPDIRSMLVCEPGYIFLQADSSQAEARVIFLLAEDYEALELIDKIDYHALTTTWFFGGKIEDYDKKVIGYESPQRFVGKTLRHAGHLGAKARRAALEVNTAARKFKIPITITESKAEDALRTFHSRQPKIVKVFHKSVIDVLERHNRKIRTPIPYGFEDKMILGGERTCYEKWGDDLFREAYGIIPQRTVSENTKAAALRIIGNEEHEITGRAPWINLHMESHDSLLVSVPIERKYEAAQILKEELERPIDFSSCSIPRGKLVIPCEVEEGYNYHKLSKFKFIDGAK